MDQGTSDLITHAYWPIVVLTAFVLFRKPVRSLIGRIRKGKGPGGFEIEADPEKTGEELEQSVADAAEPARPRISLTTTVGSVGNAFRVDAETQAAPGAEDGSRGAPIDEDRLAAMRDAEAQRRQERRAEMREAAAQQEQERRAEIERVATTAARWGQEMAATMPPRPGSYWVPVFNWSDDGTVRLTYGRREPVEAGRTTFSVVLPEGVDKKSWNTTVRQLKRWVAASNPDAVVRIHGDGVKDAEGNDSRQD